MLLDRILVEIAHFVDREIDDDLATLARSLIATIHGHCSFAISGAWALMGEAAPEAAALARVRQALAARSAR